jgi:hypothetical protein
MHTQAPHASVKDFHAQAFKTFPSYSMRLHKKDTNTTHFWNSYDVTATYGPHTSDTRRYICNANTLLRQGCSYRVFSAK